MGQQIKYSYCLDEKDELIHINNVTVDNRHSHTFRCLGCGQEMVANLGTKRAWHFSHKSETACDGESYLHKLAKRRIREKFISSDSFPIIFKRNVPCQEAEKCVFYTKEDCIEEDVSILRNLKTWNGKDIYDTCQEEKSVGAFRPDLLLTGPMDMKLGQVFIEIYKTHESEEPKVISEYKIIETMKIKSEADIDDIINRGFVENENCHTHNFTPTLPSIRKKDIPITRFILFGSGAAKVFSSVDYIVTCEKKSQRANPNSIRELNIAGSGIDIWGDNEELDVLDSYQTGLVYLIKKGMELKNCILCRFYKYNEWQNNHVCIRYKTLGEQYHFPKQTAAKKCPLYEINQRLFNHQLSELEKNVSEVPL